MQIYLPWIQKRLIIIRNIFKDSLIYFTSFFILQLELNLKTNLLFIIFYILTSYLIGRYHYYQEKKFKIFIIEFLILPISIFTFGIFGLKTIYILFLLINFTFSIFFKIVFSTKNNNATNKTWHLIGFDKVKNKNYNADLFEKTVGKNLVIKHINDIELIRNKSKDKNGFIICDYRKLEESQVKKLLSLRNSGYEVKSLLDFCDKNLQRYPSLLLTDIHILSGWFDLSTKKIELRIKRISELVFSILILLISWPIILFSTFLIYIEDKGPVIYSQIRTGFKGKSIKIYKLRTMKISNESQEIFKWAIKDDPRVTVVGKYLRKFRIDELPQLLSVIKGEMSLIGPRPEIPTIEDNLRKNISFYDLKFYIKPGLSGWAQVNYPYGASTLDSNIKLSYDLFYIKNFSIWLDILIFFKTLKLVLNGRGAIAQDNKKMKI
mgnify:CR=1 FL=1